MRASAEAYDELDTACQGHVIASLEAMYVAPRCLELAFLESALTGFLHHQSMRFDRSRSYMGAT